jgi:hypothetical protein
MNEFKKRERRRSYERKIQQIPYLYIIALHYGMQQYISNGAKEY